MPKTTREDEWYDDHTDDLSAASGIGRWVFISVLVMATIWSLVAHS